MSDLAGMGVSTVWDWDKRPDIVHLHPPLMEISAYENRAADRSV